ncbi:MAG: PAS domain-containing protein [Rhodocyclaceae bacterium]|nr:PAS domain-containing protein [Rhodocyclaceae bacterium]
MNSFRNRLAFLIGGLLLLTLGAYSAYTAIEQAEFVEEVIVDQAHGTATLIADALRLEALSGPDDFQSPAIVSHIRAHAQGMSYHVIEIVDASGQKLLRLPGPVGDPNRHLEAFPPEERVAITRSVPDALETWVPINAIPGMSCWLRIELDDGPVSRARNHLLRDSLIVGAILLLLSVIAASLALARPARTLESMARFASALDSDDQPPLRAVDRSREFVALERALNASADRLRERRQALIDSERRFRMMLDNLSELVFETDAELRIEYLNPTWQRFISLGRDGGTGRSLPSLLSESEAGTQQLAEQLLALADDADANASLEIKLEGEAGEHHWFNLRIQRRSSGQHPGYVGSASDITALKRVEQVLQEDKLLAEEANRTKSSFLANMSHELRTPMNAVIGMTDLVLETPLNDEQRGFLTHSRNAAENLLAIINEILDFSKMESGRLDFEHIPFGLRDCVEQAFAIHRDMAQKKGLLLEYRIDPTVPDALEGDPHRLRQVIQNLISNGVKFTEHGHVVARITAEQISDASCTLRISIEDTGIGIADGHRGRIFEAFTQVDESATRRHGGTGLGLAVAQRLVERMKGHIELTSSRPDVGSTFSFTAQLARQPGAQAEALDVPLETLRIMLAGDEDVDVRSLRDALRVWQLQPEVEGLGMRVLARVRQSASSDHPVHVLILSDHLKDMDAFELARRLRSDASIRQPTIILISSSGQRGDAAQCRQIGIDAYLTRPIKPLDLLDAIMLAHHNTGRERLVTRHSLREQRRSLQILIATHDSGHSTTHQLEQLGHVVHAVNNGVEVIESCHAAHFDVILLDGLLGSPDAMTVMVRLQEMRPRLDSPVIALVPRGYDELALSLESAGVTQSLVSPPSIAALVIALRNVGNAGVARNRQPEPAQEPNASGLKICDPEKALSYLDNDADLLRQLIQVYLESDLSLRMRLREAVALGDLHAAHSAVHAIGGSVGSFMAEATLAAVSRIEVRCRSGNSNGIGEDLQALWQQMDLLATALGKLLQEHGEASATA